MRKKALWVKIGENTNRTTKAYSKAAKQMKRRKPIRRVSKATAKAKRAYNARVKVWLNEGIGGTRKACQAPGCKHLATQCHHQRGRAGRLLMDERFWIPLCDDCHSFTHNNIEAARRCGLICKIGLWNKPAEADEPLY